MKKVAIHNLGCKVNSYELDVVVSKLKENGYEIVPFTEKADIYIVNTCSVTNIADRKSRQMLHRARTMSPEAVVVAMGCYVQTDVENVLKDEGIDLAIGNNKKKDIIPILEEYLAGRENKKEDLKTLEGKTIIEINKPCEYEEMTLEQTAEHTRAYIKIQDGCNQFCTYCIIPYARGRVRSRGKEELLAEIRGLAQKGYREIVLTGIHISSYGTERKDGYELIHLLEDIERIEGIDRIRLGSLEPRIVTEEFARRMAALKKICPHFHLSLQSGCDEVLRRMNRHYTAEEYYKCVELLREVFDHPAITTDVIVGFPGETEEEFLTCKAFLEKVSFYEMHIFKYSRRKGTPADKMPGQLTDAVKTERSNQLLTLEAQQSKAFRADYIDKETEVLFEEAKVIQGQTYQIGHTADYVKVAVPTEENLSNQLALVRPESFLTDEILKSCVFSLKFSAK